MFGATSSAFGASSGTGFSSFSATASNTNPMKDFVVAQPPDDTVSCMQFSSKADYLVASSWDNNVSI